MTDASYLLAALEAAESWHFWFQTRRRLVDRSRAALGGMFEALRPVGGLIVTVPQHPRLWSAVDEFSHHRRRYTRPELDCKVRVTGFEVVRRTSPRERHGCIPS